jgi:hypothetical protein
VIGKPRAELSEPRVKTLIIVAEFDLPGNIYPSVFPGRINTAIDPLDSPIIFLTRSLGGESRFTTSETEPGSPDDVVVGRYGWG